MNATACDLPGPHAGRVRPFPAGPRCEIHTPAALAGQAEAPEPETKEQP
jgi:hypothetical protein